MNARFEELDRRETPMGVISVRRRLEPTLHVDVYEVKLDDDFLMSSLFTVAEIALADLALGASVGSDLDVVVGGLGLGYTAHAALADPRVRSLHVVEALGAVIEWHEQRLLPRSGELVDDPRCEFVHDDFFARLAAGDRFGPDAPARCHGVLLDIDHSPRHLLHPSHASFYTDVGLAALAGALHPGGVFGLWSDDPADEPFLAAMRRVFASADAHTVTFPNFYTGGESTATVYIGSLGGA